MPVCSKCEKNKSFTLFKKHPSGKPHAKCQDCENARQVEIRLERKAARSAQIASEAISDGNGLAGRRQPLERRQP
jgi:hypothetical protein